MEENGDSIHQEVDYPGPVYGDRVEFRVVGVKNMVGEIGDQHYGVTG